MLRIINKIYRPKVTLLVVIAVFATTATSNADDLVTLSGKRFKKVRVIEITPATIAFVHSSGVARIAFAEFGPDVQKKYGYDEAKARAWLAQQTRQTAEVAKAEQVREAKRKADLYRANELRLQIEDLARSGDAMDPVTGRFYNAEAAQRQRAAAVEWLQRHGSINAHATAAPH